MTTPKCTSWQDISTAPLHTKIDVWAVEIGGEGFRFPEVELRDDEPHVLAIWEDDSEPRYYAPHENGVYLSHWMPLPPAPQPTPKPESVSP